SQDLDTADGRETGIPVFDNTVVFQNDGFRQFITQRVFLESQVRSLNMFASVGLTDRIDLAVSVPVLSVKVSGTTSESFDVTRTYNANTERGAATRADRGAPVGLLNIQVPANPLPSESATGIGDVMIRAKFGLTGQQSNQGVALAADVT